MKTWRAWLQRDDDALERLRLDGATLAECAATLGRTEASVKGRLRQLDCPKVSRTLLGWLALLGKPHRNADVARSRGVSVFTVRAAAWKLRRAGYDVSMSGDRNG